MRDPGPWRSTATFRPTPRRRITFTTSSARTTSTKPRPPLPNVIRRIAAAALIVAFAALPCRIARADTAPTVAALLAAYDRATNTEGITALETRGTIAGQGLRGVFHTWRSGADERDDEQLGPGTETTLRIGDRIFIRSVSGNVRELNGYLKRRALTEEFIDDGTFVHAPERSRYVGTADVDGRRVARLEVNAVGGEPETLSIDMASGLPVRIEYVDDDGTTTIDFSDWHTIAGHAFPFTSITSDGSRDFDVVEKTTSIVLNAPIDAALFALPPNRTLAAPSVQTVPLAIAAGHIACDVTVGPHPYRFLVDSGAQSVLLDTRVVKAAGLHQEGALEVLGATRGGGLHILTIPRLGIGTAHLDDLVATSIDLRASSGGEVRADGILGFPFFASALVEIDIAHRTMRFGPPGSFVPRGEKIALDLDRGIVETVARINDRIDASFMIDTGNSGALLLYQAFVDAHPGLVPFTGDTSRNVGIGGSIASYRTFVDQLQLGSTALYHTAADVELADRGAFADKIDAGNIGLDILKKFVVTFDLTNDAMYLAKADISAP